MRTLKVCFVSGISALMLSACGGGGSPSYSSFTDTTQTTGTTVSLLRGQGSFGANSTVATYNHQTTNIGTLTTSNELTSGYSYVRRVNSASANSGEQLAIVPTVASDLPTGTVIYTGAAGTSAINIVDGTNTNWNTYDDPTASASITVNFNGLPIPRANAVVTLSNATVTNSTGATSTLGSATATIRNLPLSAGVFSGSGASVTFSGLGTTSLTGATVNAAGGLAGPNGAELGAVVTSVDTDTQMTVIMTGKKP